METKTKQKSVGPVIADDLNKITFKVAGYPDIVLDMGKLHPDIVKRAACAGMAQVRIIDAAAVPRADGAGGVRTDAEMARLKYERMKALVDHYMTGTSEWAQGRGTGGAAKEGGITLAAMARVWPGRDVEALVTGIMAKRKIDRKAALALFAGTKEVAAAIAAIKAERATLNADDLLDGLGD